MNKRILFAWLLFLAMSVSAASEPTLLVLTTSVGEVQVPIASIHKITYTKTTPLQMNILTTTGMQTYALSDVVRMNLTNVPEPTALEQLTPTQVSDCQKVMMNGVVYVVKDGKIYTLKGETKQ